MTMPVHPGSSEAIPFWAWRHSDGYEARGRVIAPAAARSERAFLILHGIQSHGGWYEASARRLAENGALVVMPDRRGSGLNTAARGDAPSAERWFLDLNEVFDWCAAAHGITQLDIVGISWGGKLAVGWALRHPERVGRLLLITPGVFPAVGVSVARQMQIGWSVLRDPQRRFAIPLDDPRLFTENPARQEFIARDPLALGEATARFLYFSTRLDRRLRSLPRGGLAAPTTLLLAERDRIIRNAPTQAWTERICRQPPVIKNCSGAAHTLEFEADSATYERLLADWRATCAA